MRVLKVKQLSDVSGVSVKTLHHYDKIGLLNPSNRTEKGYRLYEENEILRLQQILFYRELEFLLSQIKEILDRDGFDMLQAMEYQKNALTTKRNRIDKLLDTLNNTINSICMEKNMLTEKEIFAGFTEETAEKHKFEVIDKFGEDSYQNSMNKIRKLSKTEWNELQEEGEEINKLLASSVNLSPESESVQKLIERHYRFIEQHMDLNKDIYGCLGEMYENDSRFSEYYNKYSPDLASFLNKAIQIYCS